MTGKMFREWVSNYEETDFVREQRKVITRLHSELFADPEVTTERGPVMTHIDHSEDLPIQMSKETYIFMYRQVWATIRFDLYRELIKAKKQAGKAITEDDFAKLYEARLNDFEKYRNEIY